MFFKCWEVVKDVFLLYVLCSYRGYNKYYIRKWNGDEKIDFINLTISVLILLMFCVFLPSLKSIAEYSKVRNDTKIKRYLSLLEKEKIDISNMKYTYIFNEEKRTGDFERDKNTIE